MITKGVSRNLGDPVCFLHVVEYRLTIEEKGSWDDILEVGSVHSRGVAWVMPCANVKFTRRD